MHAAFITNRNYTFTVRCPSPTIYGLLAISDPIGSYSTSLDSKLTREHTSSGLNEVCLLIEPCSRASRRSRTLSLVTALGQFNLAYNVHLPGICRVEYHYMISVLRPD